MREPGLSRPARRLPRWHWGEPVEPLRDLLAAGGIMMIPTESSYGLGADPRNHRGVETIYRIKQRESGKPLPVVVADVGQALALGVSEATPELELLRRLWPAPLTAVLPIRRPLAASAGNTTLAVRVPAHRRLRRLLRELGFGLTATSANRAGEPPILEAGGLDALWADSGAGARESEVVVVDDGRLPGGPPSTLVAWTAGRAQILRQGAFAQTELERVPGADDGSSTPSDA